MGKSLLLILITALLISDLNGQQVDNGFFVVIDKEEIKGSIKNEVSSKEIEGDNLKLVKERIITERIGRLMIDFTIINKRIQGGCISLEQQEKYLDYIQDLEDQIINYDSDTETIISEYIYQQEKEIDKYIKISIIRFCKSNNVKFAISKNKVLFKLRDIIDITQDLIEDTRADRQELINSMRTNFKSALNKMNEADELYSTELLFDDGEYLTMGGSKIENIQLILENMKRRELFRRKH